MIKLYLITTVILTMIITIAVGIIKPGINKPVQFAGSDFQITNTELAQNPDATHKPPSQTTKIINTEPAQPQIVEKIIETTSPKPVQKTQTVKNTTNTTTKTKEIQTTAPKPKTTTITKNQTQIKTTTKTVTTASQQPVKTTETVKTAQIPQSIKDIVSGTQKPQQKTETSPPKEPEKIVLPAVEPTKTPDKIIEDIGKEDRPLTEQEEIIVWNIWRSNLQNQIMRDTQISAPLGTSFKFSFTVDKKGRISNLKTWASPADYNSVAINYLKPLILSYQGQPILNFPSRTKRVITNVTGGFVISTQDKFSTPGDFSDIEKIKTYK